MKVYLVLEGPRGPGDNNKILAAYDNSESALARVKEEKRKHPLRWSEAWWVHEVTLVGTTSENTCTSCGSKDHAVYCGYCA